ncbi:MAG: hypothetical protein HDR88_04065 [Bacteroides sp.]|nr:hypothetical protein [Bacteroides sp.]
MEPQKLVLFVLSCDAYQDLWDDFFSLRDKYWADCPFKWYLVTETADFCHNNVTVIKCGDNLNWAGRLKHAIKSVDSHYYGIFLEDYFIYEKIQNEIIIDLIEIMEKHGVTFLNTSDVFRNCIGMKNKSYFRDNLILIPNNKRYGVSTEAGIWQREYLLEKLGDSDYSAWQFEVDRVNEAKSEAGLGGFNLCDDRMPFHASIIPVVIQGKVYPPSRRFFNKQGYTFKTQRENMSLKQVLLYRLKVKAARIKYGRRLIKWIAIKCLGMKFFS